MKYWHLAIKIPLQYVFIGLFLCQIPFVDVCNAQEFTFRDNRKREGFHFKFVKNLIIIPIYLNSKGPFNFILDTGVGPMVVTDPSLLDSLNLKDLKTTKIYGLGEGQEIEAFFTNNIIVNVKNAQLDRMPTAFLKEDIFNLSSYLGEKIYGLIGFPFFNSFVVKVNYNSSRLTYAIPTEKVKKRGTKLPIVLESNRPYIYADLKTATEENIKVKLIIDCGASHALSMYSLNGKAFPLPKEIISANLGVGLSGIIKGSMGRIEKLTLGKYSFENVLSGFPNYEVFAAKAGYDQQNGNLGADVLKHFNIIYDYQNLAIYLKPNQNYSDAFEHDMSGIELFSDAKYLKRMFIGRIEPNSPAEKAGLLEQDEILSINLRTVSDFTLEEVSELFKSQDGKVILIETYRDDKSIIKLLKLKRRI